MLPKFILNTEYQGKPVKVTSISRRHFCSCLDVFIELVLLSLLQ